MELRLDSKCFDSFTMIHYSFYNLKHASYYKVLRLWSSYLQQRLGEHNSEPYGWKKI